MLPDHIAALQSALDNRLAEAMAFGLSQSPDAVAAWHRVAATQLSLNAALALDMQRRPFPRKVA
jgi:hypothetical protein